jgi:hypothetical protein
MGSARIHMPFRPALSLHLVLGVVHGPACKVACFETGVRQGRHGAEIDPQGAPVLAVLGVVYGPHAGAVPIHRRVDHGQGTAVADQPQIVMGGGAPHGYFNVPSGEIITGRAHGNVAVDIHPGILAVVSHGIQAGQVSCHAGCRIAGFLSLENAVIAVDECVPWVQRDDRQSDISRQPARRTKSVGGSHPVVVGAARGTGSIGIGHSIGGQGGCQGAPAASSVGAPLHRIARLSFCVVRPSEVDVCLILRKVQTRRVPPP